MFLKSEQTNLPDQISAYNQSRHLLDKEYLCNAPFNNMYFNIHGQAAPCWLTLVGADNVKDKTILQIWKGDRFNSIREAIKRKDLAYACSTCEKNIQCGNFVSVLAKLYDLPYQLSDYPSEMEFELSNICNLECVMCKGDLSSAIRKNREHLPAIESPYNDTFVEQLKEFLPHLKEAKFLGGEPFLVPIYYKIWDTIIQINPQIKITITTNGTVWNARVKEILESLYCNIIISIDSFSKTTYESIRLGSRFEKVMEHFEFYRDYTTRKGTYMGVSINPLRKNHNELADYVDFCNKKNVPLWFNTVTYPYREAIWTLPAAKLKLIYEDLSGRQLLPPSPECSPSVYDNNLRNFKNLVEVQIKTWWTEANEREINRQKELKTFQSDDLLKKFQERLFNYVYSDAYVPLEVRKNTVLRISKQLEEPKFTFEKIQEIYTLPEEEALCFFENEI